MRLVRLTNGGRMGWSPSFRCIGPAKAGTPTHQTNSAEPRESARPHFDLVIGFSADTVTLIVCSCFVIFVSSGALLIEMVRLPVRLRVVSYCTKRPVVLSK